MNASTSRSTAAASRTARALDLLFLLAALAVCAVMSAWAWVYVDRYASTIPYYDDMELAWNIAPGNVTTWETLWRPANEHRIPIPRAIYLALIGVTRSFRSGMFFQVVVLGLLSLVMIFAARALRGRSSPADVLFPLALLHWGNAENLMLGMQITIVVPVALVMLFVLLEVVRAQPYGPGRAALMSACLLMLPGNGGFGLMHVPPLVAFAFARGWSLLRKPAGRERAAGVVLSLGALATAALTWFYFVDFHFPAHTHRTFDLWRILWTAVQFLSLNLGPIGQKNPVLVPLLALIFPLIALVALARAWRAEPERRWQAAGLLAGMAAAATIALSIGVGRASAHPLAGLATRYVILPIVWYLCAYLALCRFGPRWLGFVGQTSVAAALVCLIPYHVKFGKYFGNMRRQESDWLQRQVVAGRNVADIAREHYKVAYPSYEGYRARLELLRAAGFPPFRGVKTPEREPEQLPAEWAVFDCQPPPLRVLSPKPPAGRKLFGERALVLRADSEVALAIPPKATVLEATYGILPTFSKREGERRTEGLRVMVFLRPQGGGKPQMLFERVLDPKQGKADRGAQSLRVEVPPGTRGELALAMRSVASGDQQYDWGFWSDVSLR
jgi:hypothetical protein